MSDVIIVAIIVATPAVFSAILTSIVSIRLGRYHKQNNSRMDELIASVKSEALLRGKQQGREELKDEQKAKK